MDMGFELHQFNLTYRIITIIITIMYVMEEEENTRDWFIFFSV